MRQLFPLKQVSGFVLSLALTAVALSVLLFDMSPAVGMLILLVTAFAQAGLQLVVFMHAGESKDRGSIYTAVYYGLIIAIATIIGTMITLVWDMM